jgi:5-methyltetrahydropteroyltriglutamate--homocysteine methyltransferase
MERSDGGIPTTHTGSLPRPKELTEALKLRDAGELPEDRAAGLPGEVREAVNGVVRRQVEAGLDYVNDGEMGKIGYATYVKERLTGFDGEAGALGIADLAEFPSLTERALEGLDVATPACTGPVEYRGHEAVAEDIANLKAATEGTEAKDVFMNAASPGVISIYLQNQHYPGHEEYLAALSEAMRVEYEAIHDAGFVLQLDCPDLAMGRHVGPKELSVGEFRERAALHMEAINEATRNVAPDGFRLHVCWGNYEGPHHHDIPLRDIVDIVFRTRARTILFEAANARHEHEWRVFEEVEVPEDKVLVPGVIDTTSNVVEHPELVAERIVRFANVLGRERVVAGTDCGFATFATFLPVDPGVAWLKIGALTEGAALASERLW